MSEFFLGNASFGYWTDIASYETLREAVAHGRALRMESDCRYQVWRAASGPDDLETLVWETRDEI